MRATTFKESRAYRKLKSNPIGWKLLLLTLLYFLVEGFINYTLYNQLSTGSDYFTIESLELWGKIITGLGMALIIVKFISATVGIRKNTFKIYAAWCIVGITLSFFITNSIISYVVNKADEQQRNSALLIAATKSTLVPHYDFSMASYPTDDLDMSTFDKLTYPFRDRKKTTSVSYVTHKAAFMDISQECASIGQERLGFNSNIDKAFFGISSLNSFADEALYKSAIKDYYSCLYSDTEYRDNHSKGKAMPIDGLKSMHAKYTEASGRYFAALIRTQGDNSLTAEKVNEEWRKEMDKFFGFKTKLRPSMHWENFVRNSDVRRYYMQQVGGDVDLYPFDEDYKEVFKASITKTLPDSVIPLYISNTSKTNPISLDESDEGLRIEAGKKAYKAIVLPIVGMGMSAFFLVINLIILIMSVAVWYKAPKTLIVLLLGSLYWLFVSPISSLSGDDPERAYVSGLNYKTDLVYYHQRNISHIYDRNPSDKSSDE